MSIIKILARTFILLVCGIFQMIGVLAEGLYKLSTKIGEGLVKLDDKLKKEPVKKEKTKTEEVPT